MVAKSAPDGYTLLMGHVGTLAVAPSLYPNLPYDPAKSFAPVSLVATVAEFAGRIAAERVRWREVVETAKIQPE